MSTMLRPWQVTGNLATTAHDMLYMKQSPSMQNKSVFGQGYFNLASPAKTFKSRNFSLAHDSSNTKKKPMRVKETLGQMSTGFNYSFRKFMLRSDKGVDNKLPTDLSVANLMHEKVMPDPETAD